MRAPRARSRAAAQKTCALFALCAFFALSCTDPRARPVPPSVDLLFTPGLVVTSPGTIAGSLHAYDVDGLANLRLELFTADNAVAIDSFVALDPEVEQIRGLSFQIPDGLAVGTQLTLVTMVSDQAGFQTTDSTFFTTQPTP